MDLIRYLACSEAMVQIELLCNLWGLSGTITGPDNRAGKAATFLTAAGKIMEHRVVLKAVHEVGVLLVCALPLRRLPQRREGAHVAPGRVPLPILHHLLQMRNIEIRQGILLQPEISIGTFS